MTDDNTAALEREAKAQKAAERAAEGALAMAEYEAEKLAVEANTARLRALRLEKEQADRKAAEALAAKPATKRQRASAAS